jgi:hypothetical protein
VVGWRVYLVGWVMAVVLVMAVEAWPRVEMVVVGPVGWTVAGAGEELVAVMAVRSQPRVDMAWQLGLWVGGVVVVVALRQGWEEEAVAGTLGLWAGKAELHSWVVEGDLGRVVEKIPAVLRDTKGVRVVMV